MLQVHEPGGSQPLGGYRLLGQGIAVTQDVPKDLAERLRKLLGDVERSADRAVQQAQIGGLEPTRNRPLAEPVHRIDQAHAGFGRHAGGFGGEAVADVVFAVIEGADVACC